MISPQLPGSLAVPNFVAVRAGDISECPVVQGRPGTDTTTLGVSSQDGGIYGLVPFSNGDDSHTKSLTGAGLRSAIQSAVVGANSTALSSVVGSCPKVG